MRSNESINVKGVQRLNRLCVVNLIRKNGSAVRSDIGKYSGLSPAAISGIVSYLMNIGLVVESGVENVERTGRKGVILRFCSSRYTILTAGCDNDELLRVSLTDLSGEVIAQKECRIAGMDGESITAQLCANAEALLRLPEAQRVIAIGLSVSGMVLDHGENVLSAAVPWNLPAIRSRLKKLRDVPVLVSNSTFTKANWLCRGSMNEEKGLSVFVDLSGGIGAAVLQDGARLSAVAGEIGQTIVAKGDPEDGEKRGWLETMCSPKRLLRLYHARSGKTVSDMASFSALLAQGDSAASEVLEECAEYLGCGLANLVALFDPQKMMINAFDYADCPQMVARALEVMRSRLYRGIGKNLHVEVLGFRDRDFVSAMAQELCDSLFSEQLPVDVFALMDEIAQ